jgi:uncharacterized protein (DUF427 family)
MIGPRLRLNFSAASAQDGVSRIMDDTIAIAIAIDGLGSLAQPTRLTVFRKLLAAHPGTVPVPPADVRSEFLIPSRTTSTCPYKGEASYWSVRVGDRTANDSVWAYLAPLPECPRIKGYHCFYPEKLDRLEVEGEA